MSPTVDDQQMTHMEGGGCCERHPKVSDRDAQETTAEIEHFPRRTREGGTMQICTADGEFWPCKHALEAQVAALREALEERSREVHDEVMHPNGRWEECGARPCRDDRAALAATKEDAHGD